MTQNAIISIFVFVRFCKKNKIREMFLVILGFFHTFCMFFIFVITFEPIKMYTCPAPQNDRLSLSFVKVNCVDGGNLA